MCFPQYFSACNSNIKNHYIVVGTEQTTHIFQYFNNISLGIFINWLARTFPQIWQTTNKLWRIQQTFNTPDRKIGILWLVFYYLLSGSSREIETYFERVSIVLLTVKSLLVDNSCNSLQFLQFFNSLYCFSKTIFRPLGRL